MNSTQSVTVHNSWFDFNQQQIPHNLTQFLRGIEIISNQPELLGSNSGLISHIFRQLQVWVPDEAASKTIAAFKKAWPKITIGNVEAFIARASLEKIPKFRVMLNTDMKEANENQICLENPKNSEIASLILNYLRTGEILIDGNNVLDLIEFSSENLIESLTSLCISYLVENLSWENFVVIFPFAIKHNLSLLEKECINFAKNDGLDIGHDKKNINVWGWQRDKSALSESKMFDLLVEIDCEIPIFLCRFLNHYSNQDEHRKILNLLPNLGSIDYKIQIPREYLSAKDIKITEDFWYVSTYYPKMNSWVKANEEIEDPEYQQKLLNFHAYIYGPVAPDSYIIWQFLWFTPNELRVMIVFEDRP